MAEAPGEEAWIAASRPSLTEEEALLAAAQQAALALGSWKQDARRDPVIFSQYVLRDERTGARVQMAPHHIRWQDFISQKQRSLILAHIEAAKSSAITVGRTLWELGNDNNLRGAIISNTHAQATKLVRAVAGYIVGSTDYQAVFPEVKPSTPWTDSAITIKRRGVPKDPSLQALGIHGAIQGARLDYVVIDDILDFENARTPQSRQQLADWFTSAVLGRLSANGKLIVVGTAFHPDDLLHRLAATPPFRGRMMKTPVLDPETGQSSWPERWPMSRIEYKRQELGPLEFARQMLCEARDDTESRFKREWIEGCKVRGLGKTPAWALSGLPAGYAIVTGVDLAVQQHSAADLTVFFTLVVHPDETREVLSVEAGRWVGPEIIDRLADIHHRYHGIIVVENNACFTPDTPLLTRERGYIPIADAQVGEHVWTHAARWRPIAKVHRGMRSPSMSTVKVNGGLPVMVAPNHWFWLQERTRTKGRSGGHMRPQGGGQWVSVGFAEKACYAAMAAPRWPAADPVLPLPATRLTAARTLPVDADLAFLLGLIMADGHTSKGQVLVTLGKEDQPLADFVAAAFQKLFPDRSVRISQGDGTLRVVLCSTAMDSAISCLGTGADKTLPLAWLGWPLAVRLAVVRGWLMGDGCMVRRNQKTRWPSMYLTGSSISRNWIAWVQATLNEAGMSPSLSAVPPKEACIQGRRVHCLGAFQLDFTQADTAAFLQDAQLSVEHWRWPARPAARTRISNSPMVHGDGHVWSPIKAGPGSWAAYDGEVVNLEVEEDESYTANGYVVHNSQDFIRQFAATRGIETIPFTTGRQKAHPEYGIEGIAAELSARKWIIPNLGGICDPQIEAWIGEMLWYNPQGHTGDRLMAAWFAREGARQVKMHKAKAQTGRLDLGVR